MNASTQSDEGNGRPEQITEQLSDEDEQFLRELAELNDDEALPKGTPSPEESPPEEPIYPEFVPDQRDMEQLAHSYLEESVSLFCFTFRDVREGKRNGKDRTDWAKEGF